VRVGILLLAVVLALVADPASAQNGRRPVLSAESVLLLDAHGKVLFSKNPSEDHAPASLVKLMTLYLACEALDAGRAQWEEPVLVSHRAALTPRYRMGLKNGESVPLRTLLEGVAIASANDAATAVAEHLGGTEDAFVAAMNAKAEALGMRHSRFVDSTGLHSENVSTAEELVKMVKASYTYGVIREYTTTASHDVDIPGRRHSVEFRNTNVLVRNKQWDIGLSKTGFINEAGRCLVMQVQIASRSVIIVLLDSFGKYTRISDANRIKKWVENGRGRRVAQAEIPRRGV